MLAKSACQESEFKLAQPLLVGLRGILHQIEPYMETIGYEISFLVFDQFGIVSLQDGMITYFTYEELSMGHELVGYVVLYWPQNTLL
jgi:hypothetical protein